MGNEKTTTFLKPFAIAIDLEKGIMSNPKNHLVRKKCAMEKMARGKMVYVPPYWAHRSINIGDEPLISFCVYPGDAGHNYGDIEQEGFPKRIFERNREIVIQ